MENDNYRVYYHSCPSQRERKPAVCLSCVLSVHRTNELMQGTIKRLDIMLLIFRSLLFLLINVSLSWMQLQRLLVFFFFPRRLNNHSLRLLSLPEQSININGFLGITKRARKEAAAAGCLRFTCNLSARSVLPSHTERRSFV